MVWLLICQNTLKNSKNKNLFSSLVAPFNGGFFFSKINFALQIANFISKFPSQYAKSKISCEQKCSLSFI
ncbi:hypothetical protein BGP_4922 [Beggiatoa sp. PS]|nr:hypothetical protein BGP_4922 [Beggiatoa sp. PS]